MTSIDTPGVNLMEAPLHAAQIVARHGHEVAVALIRDNIAKAKRDWPRAYWGAALAAIAERA